MELPRDPEREPETAEAADTPAESLRGSQREVASTQERRFLLLAALVAVLASLALKWLVLGNIPHGWDATSYYFQAETLASGRFRAPSTPFVEFFWLEHVYNHTVFRISMYPPGWPTALAVGVLVGMPELINALFAGAFVGLLWWIARRLLGRGAGWIAAGLALVSPFFLFMSASYLAHLPCATALLATLAALIRSFESERTRPALAWGFVAGLAFGYAFLTRPFSAALGLVCIGWLLAWRRGLEWRQWGWATFGSLPAGMISLLVLFAFNELTTGSPWLSGYKLTHPDLNFLGMEGFFRSSVFRNLAINVPKSLAALSQETWGGWVPDLLPAAALVLVRPRDRRTWGLLGAFLIFVAGQGLYYYFDLHYGPRLVFESLPFLLLASALGIWSVWEWAGRQRGPRFGSDSVPQGWGWKRVALAAILVSHFAYAAAFGGWPRLIRYYSADYSGQGSEVVRAVREKALENAVVFVRSDDAFAYANVALLNPVDIRSAPVIFARFVPGRIPAMIRSFPRSEYWVLDLEFEPLPGRNEYADRFRVKTLEWVLLEEAMRSEEVR